MFLGSWRNFLNVVIEWGGSARQIVSYRDICLPGGTAAPITPSIGKPVVNRCAAHSNWRWTHVAPAPTRLETGDFVRFLGPAAAFLQQTRRPCCGAAQSSGSTGCFWVISPRDELKTQVRAAPHRGRGWVMAVRTSRASPCCWLDARRLHAGDARACHPTPISSRATRSCWPMRHMRRRRFRKPTSATSSTITARKRRARSSSIPMRAISTTCCPRARRSATA